LPTRQPSKHCSRLLDWHSHMVRRRANNPRRRGKAQFASNCWFPSVESFSTSTMCWLRSTEQTAVTTEHSYTAHLLRLQTAASCRDRLRANREGSQISQGERALRAPFPLVTSSSVPCIGAIGWQKRARIACRIVGKSCDHHIAPSLLSFTLRVEGYARHCDAVGCSPAASGSRCCLEGKAFGAEHAGMGTCQ